jgi:type IV secretion system protein TrbL
MKPITAAKKSALLALISVLASSPLYAFKLDDLMTTAYNEFDLPLVDGILYFMDASYSFIRIAQVLATLLGVVCIIWNAFRLWMGTEQVRKACVDIIVKFLIFIVAFNLYPAVIDGTINLAINIGMTSGGGYNYLAKEYYALYKSCEVKIDAAKELMNKVIEQNKDAVSAIDEKSVKALAEATNQDFSDLAAFLGQNEINVYTQEQVDSASGVSLDLDWVNALNPVMLAFRVFGLTPKPDNVGWGARNELINNINTANRKITDVLKEQFKEMGVQRAANTLRAMAEVFQITKVERNGAIIEEYFYNPYIKQKTGHANLISPGSMIKSAVVIGEVLSVKESSYYDDETGTFKQLNFVDATAQRLMHFILLALMSFGVIAAVVFFSIQYIMCIFEYFIVSAVGIIFIPFCLWDGTKSFTAKLVTLFTAYFIKIMVMMLCVMWVFGAFLRMGNIVIGDPEGINFLNFSYFIFTLMLGWVVTQNAPQIAVTILNGSPQLSMGEFMHAAGTAAGAACAARGAIGAAGKVGQGIGRGATTGAAGVAGSVAQGMRTFKETGSAGKAVGSGVGKGLEFAAHGIKNSAAKLLTGQETQSHKNGISVGSSTGKDGKPLTHAEALQRAMKAPPPQEKKEAAEKNALKVGGGGNEQGGGKLTVGPAGSARPAARRHRPSKSS